MTDEELEHRLTAVENRAQSNTHRLDELGKLTDAVNGMNTNIKLTIQQLENTNKSLEIVTAQNKKQDDRLTALEKSPRNIWEQTLVGCDCGVGFRPCGI